MTYTVNQILQDRPQSGFPVSIATGLALETIFEPTQQVFDETRIVPERADPYLYTDYLFNTSTIARNVITSVPYADLAKCSTKDVVYTFLEELDYLQTLFQMQDRQLHLYVNSYAYARQTYPDKMRKATTQQQIHSFDLVSACMKEAKKLPNVLNFSKDISLDSKPSTLLLSHVPWDLLSYGKFKKLDLLETHTGVIKTRKDWNSKYYRIPNKDMSFLPFWEYMLVTFGDQVMFKPSPTKERVELYEAMLKKKVHPLMTEIQSMMK